MVVKRTLGRLGEKTMKSSVLGVVVKHSTWLVGNMTLGRLGEMTMKPSVTEVMAEESTILVVKMILGKLGVLTKTQGRLGFNMLVVKKCTRT
jgi:hypothetical protein